MDTEEITDNVRAIIEHYENAAHPLFTSREREFNAVYDYHTHWGRTISEDDFDWAIAILFGGGCEFEWPDALTVRGSGSKV